MYSVPWGIRFQKDSQKITDDADSDCLSEEKASKLNNNLTSVITDVKNYIQESKDLSTKSKASSVSPQEFDELLQNCQGLLSSFDSFEKDDQTHLESSPEEFLSANEAMSASTSFTNRRMMKKRLPFLKWMEKLSEVRIILLLELLQPRERRTKFSCASFISFVL